MVVLYQTGMQNDQKRKIEIPICSKKNITSRLIIVCLGDNREYCFTVKDTNPLRAVLCLLRAYLDDTYHSLGPGLL